jgi:hypothetical protein
MSESGGTTTMLKNVVRLGIAAATAGVSLTLLAPAAHAAAGCNLGGVEMTFNEGTLYYEGVTYGASPGYEVYVCSGGMWIFVGYESPTPYEGSALPVVPEAV